MHKKMCNQLMRLKKNRMHIMQRKKVHHIERLAVLKNGLRKKNQCVYDDKIFNNRWDRLETAHPDI